MSTQNTTLLDALAQRKVAHTPVWLMRQAGRYLPEYRKIRGQVSDFLSLCKNPELACEVTLQPLSRFSLDAAILFSDILTIPEAMGLDLAFVENEGPVFNNPVRTIDEIQKLPIPDPSAELGYVIETVERLKPELQVPLIGFSGSPWTLACYMVEGKNTKNFATIRSMIHHIPKHLHLLLDKLAQSVTLYLTAQIQAGADVVMIFDTWGGLLNTSNYQSFSLAYMKKIIQALQASRVPVILFTKGGGLWLDSIADSGCDAIGLDWTIDIDRAKNVVGNRAALQGNLDPTVLLASPERVQTEALAILEKMDSPSGHIFNLGHGILPSTPPDNVAALIEAVHNYQSQRVEKCL